jgi:2-dehydropantoate 2-reductase
MITSPSIAFLGTGAIGASLVRALSLNSVGYTVIVRDKTRQRALKKDGIKYILGKQTTQITFSGLASVVTIAEARKYDYIFLGMKTPNLPDSARKAKQMLKKNGRIILLQNGMPESSVKGYKPEEIISGIVGYNTQLMPDGSYFQSNPGHLILATSGELPTILQAALEPHLPILLSHNVAGFRWNKLAINSVINGLGATTGLALGPLFARRDARRMAIALMQEAAAVMRASNINEGIVPGAISVYKLASYPRFLQHLILNVLGRKYAKIRTSMLQDIDRGAQTEVNEIHGAIVAAAAEVNVNVPITRAIIDRVHALEKRNTRPSPGAIGELFALSER